MKPSSGVTLYQYDLGTVLSLEHAEFAARTPNLATDFKSNLVSRTDLGIQEKAFEIQYTREGEDRPGPRTKTYQVKITKRHVLPLVNFMQCLSAPRANNPQSNNAITTIGQKGFPIVRPSTGNELGEGEVSFNASVGALRVPEKLSELINRFGNTHGHDAQRLHTFLKEIRVEITYPRVKNSAGELIKVVKTISGLAHWDDSQNYKEPGNRPVGEAQASKDKLEAPAPSAVQSGKVVGKAKGKPKGEDSQPPHGFETVYDYFDRKYELQAGGMPVVNVGNKENPAYVPPEFCLIKQHRDIKHGIHTVCVLGHGKKFFLAKNYCANLALKLNSKAGGTNRVLQNDKLRVIADGNTMVVGIDVTHPSPGSGDSAPSVAAMVASIDTKLGQWPVDLRINKSRQEMISGGQRIIRDFHKTYSSTVSEGQYENVIKQEFHPIQELCNPEYKRYGRQKASHRFYVDGSKKTNPPNGSLVDRGITGARN
ncbi:hypothetical protein OEA41_009713 [Lepraria neglecta]|uniref:Piwi domain-containing protein n=1 Tax=Lepraria neglecta TaxID=209136 RepID=A0AAD9Z2J3_9LECA|nr:hypothetical protein OEA41_009713 [Lepraria neglecta]